VEQAIELDAALAGGWVEPVGTTAFGRAVARAFASPFSMGNAASWRAPDVPRQVASVPCGAFRSEVLRRIGGFDEEQLANQDYEANYRIRRQGGTVWILPDVSFRYEPRDSLRRLGRQFVRYGFYKARTMVKHPQSIRPRHFVPAAIIVTAVGLAVSAPFSKTAALVLAATIALYCLALLVASLLAGRLLDRAAAVRLPLVFAAMHLCWGVGSVAGLLRWIPRGRTMRANVEPLSV
jgi:GT2 family glycosyltransferase